MMKGKRRSVAAVLVLVLVCSVLAACSGNSGNTGQSQQPQATGKGEENKGTAEGTSGNGGTAAFVKYDPPVTITNARTVSESVFFKPGETIDDNVHTRWVKENLGIEMKHMITAGNESDLNTKMRLALAGNQKWPDIFVTGDLQLLSEAVSAGKLMPLNDIIASYPNPKIKALFDQHPEAFYGVTHNNEIYGLPVFVEGSASPPVMYIRQDWLDHLGLPAPTTMAEFEHVLDQFTNNDPDNNGVKDTYGLTVSLKDGIVTGFVGSDGIVGAFTDSMPAAWVEDSQGGLTYGSVDKSVKPALEAMRGWMEKGYMNREAGFQDGGKASEAFVQGKAGIIFGPMWLPIWPLGATKQNNPAAVVKAYEVPSGPDGNKGFKSSPVSAQYIVFSKDFKYMDGFVAYLDAIAAVMLGDPEAPASYGFFDGYDYVADGDQAYFGNLEQSGLPKEKWPREDGSMIEVFKYFSFHGGENFLPPGIFEASAKRIAALPDSKPESFVDAEVMVRWPKEALDAYLVFMEEKEHGIADRFLGAPTRTMQSKMELLHKMEQETFNKIIYGEEPIDYFDKFSDNWYKNGGEQITKEVNEWYKSVK